MDKNLYIDQGASFTQVLETGINLTGYTVSAQIRKWYDNADYDFINVQVTNVTTGQITLFLTADVTVGLTVGRNVYDVLATNVSGNRIRVAQGQAIVTPGLTGVIPTNATTTVDYELLEIVQGSTYTHTVELRNSDGSLMSLSGYTAAMMIRPTVDSPVLIKSLTSQNGLLAIGSSTVTIALTAIDTAAFSFDTAVYDLEITSPASVVTRILGGNITLIPNITK